MRGTTHSSTTAACPFRINMDHRPCNTSTAHILTIVPMRSRSLAANVPIARRSHSHGRSARAWPIFRRVWPKLTHLQPMLDQCWLGSVWAKFGSNSPNFGRSWPSVGPTWTMLARLGTIRAKLGHMLSQVWPTCWPTYAEAWTHLGRVGALANFGQVGPGFCQHLAQLPRHLPNMAEIRPNAAESGVKPSGQPRAKFDQTWLIPVKVGQNSAELARRNLGEASCVDVSGAYAARGNRLHNYSQHGSARKYIRRCCRR